MKNFKTSFAWPEKEIDNDYKDVTNNYFYLFLQQSP